MNAIILMIPASTLLDYLTGLRTIKLPSGTKLTALWSEGSQGPSETVAQQRWTLSLRLEHPRFPEVPAGTRIPRKRVKDSTRPSEILTTGDDQKAAG